MVIIKNAFVTMPFQERFRNAMLEGPKTQTARTTKWALPGERFQVFGATFEIVGVSPRTLREVQAEYIAEGLTSPEEFVEVWQQLHPRNGWNPDQVVWVHKFKRVTVLP